MALWLHGATERMGRSISYAAGLQWLRTTRDVVKNENGDYLRRLALMKRLGFHTEAQRKAVLDGVDPDKSKLPTDPEVLRFLRATVREKQFSYDVSQSPLFFSSPVGRLFFQFQKWGFQRLRDMGRNVVAPMLGEGKVRHKGKERVVERDFMPFIRMMLLAQGAGELYALLRGLLTDRERKEGDLEELSRTYDADEQRGLMLGAERMLNNLVLDGGLGIIGDYSQLAYDMSSRGWRYKNPLEPPSIQLGKEFIGMVTDRVQRQSVTEGLGDDVIDFLTTVPLLRQPTRAAGQLLDATGSEIDWVQRQQAWRDVSDLRNTARRFANETGLDEGRSMNFIFDAKTPNSALYDDVHRALLIGDFEEVREIRLGILKDKSRTPAQRKKDMLALRTSVRNRQPLKVGGVENKEARAAFLRWLKERRPDEVNTLMEVQGRYMKAAARAGVK